MNETEIAPFDALSREDLESWFGAKITARGIAYQHQGHVQDLAHTSDGGLIAWVQGSRKYATRVDIDDGELTSSCTCPYEDACKHAVAVIMEFQARLKDERDVPQVSPRDRRLPLLEDMVIADEDQDEDAAEEPARLQKSESGSLGKYLEGQTKANLVALLQELAERFPDVDTALRDRRRLAAGSGSKLVKELRQAIYRLSSEPSWSDHWSGGSSTPDYGRVRDGLAVLLSSGHADEVVLIGKDLLEAGIQQLEMSNDEGECGQEIGSCLEIALRALPASSLKPVEQLLWAVEVDLQDQWDYFSAAREFLDRDHPITAWSGLADALMEQLDRSRGKKAQSSRYGRSRLSDVAIEALKKAGRDAEVIPLCVQEAEANADYVRLVRELLQAGQTAEAERWIQWGIDATAKLWPGIAAELQNCLRVSREQQRDWPGAAAMRAEDFFERPGLNSFGALRLACEKAKCWPNVRRWAMHYLETGERPQAGWARGKDGKLPPWPLPDPAERPTAPTWRGRFPDSKALLDIALAEKNSEEVLRWYPHHRIPTSSWGGYEQQIAEFLSKTHPERAAGIWADVAEARARAMNRRAYTEAAGNLRKAQKTLRKAGKEAEWQRVIGGFRERHRAKWSLMELLNALPE